MLPGILVLLALPFVAVGYIVIGLVKGGELLMKWIKQADSRRKIRIEAELDRTQDELRRTILSLANALGMESHEARKALIRESYRASGQVPNQSE